MPKKTQRNHRKAPKVNLEPPIVIECPHVHFRADIIDRGILSRTQHLNLLSTPKGYRWDVKKEDQDKGDDQIEGGKSATSVYRSGPKVVCGRRIRRPEQAYKLHNFLAEIWASLTPEMVDRLKKMLMTEFGMSSAEAEMFVVQQRNKSVQNSSYDKVEETKKCKCCHNNCTITIKKRSDAYKPKIKLSNRHQWVKDLSKLVSGKLNDYIVTQLSARRGKKVKELASRVLEQLCDLTGEHCTLNNPKTRVQRILVFAADRLALWVLNDMRQKCKHEVIECECGCISPEKLPEDKDNITPNTNLTSATPGASEKQDYPALKTYREEAEKLLKSKELLSDSYIKQVIKPSSDYPTVEKYREEAEQLLKSKELSDSYITKEPTSKDYPAMKTYGEVAENLLKSKELSDKYITKDIKPSPFQKSGGYEVPNGSKLLVKTPDTSELSAINGPQDTSKLPIAQSVQEASKLSQKKGSELSIKSYTPPKFSRTNLLDIKSAKSAPSLETRLSKVSFFDENKKRSLDITVVKNEDGKYVVSVIGDIEKVQKLVGRTPSQELVFLLEQIAKKRKAPTKDVSLIDKNLLDDAAIECVYDDASKQLNAVVFQNGKPTSKHQLSNISLKISMDKPELAMIDKSKQEPTKTDKDKKSSDTSPEKKTKTAKRSRSSSKEGKLEVILEETVSPDLSIATEVKDSIMREASKSNGEQLLKRKELSDSYITKEPTSKDYPVMKTYKEVAENLLKSKELSDTYITKEPTSKDYPVMKTYREVAENLLKSKELSDSYITKEPTEPVPSSSKNADIKIGKSETSKLDKSKELHTLDSGLLKLEAGKDPNVIAQETEILGKTQRKSIVEDKIKSAEFTKVRKVEHINKVTQTDKKPMADEFTETLAEQVTEISCQTSPQRNLGKKDVIDKSKIRTLDNAIKSATEYTEARKVEHINEVTQTDKEIKPTMVDEFTETVVGQTGIQRDLNKAEGKKSDKAESNVPTNVDGNPKEPTAKRKPDTSLSIIEIRNQAESSDDKTPDIIIYKPGSSIIITGSETLDIKIVEKKTSVNEIKKEGVTAKMSEFLSNKSAHKIESDKQVHMESGISEDAHKAPVKIESDLEKAKLEVISVVLSKIESDSKKVHIEESGRFEDIHTTPIKIESAKDLGKPLKSKVIPMASSKIEKDSKEVHIEESGTFEGIHLNPIKIGSAKDLGKPLKVGESKKQGISVVPGKIGSDLKEAHIKESEDIHKPSKLESRDLEKPPKLEDRSKKEDIPPGKSLDSATKTVRKEVVKPTVSKERPSPDNKPQARLPRKLKETEKEDRPAIEIIRHDPRMENGEEKIQPHLVKQYKEPIIKGNLEEDIIDVPVKIKSGQDPETSIVHIKENAISGDVHKASSIIKSDLKVNIEESVRSEDIHKISAQDIEEVMCTEDMNKRSITKNIPGPSAPSIIESALSPSSKLESARDLGKQKLEDKSKKEDILVPSRKISIQSLESAISSITDRKSGLIEILKPTFSKERISLDNQPRRYSSKELKEIERKKRPVYQVIPLDPIIENGVQKSQPYLVKRFKGPIIKGKCPEEYISDAPVNEENGKNKLVSSLKSESVDLEKSQERHLKDSSVPSITVIPSQIKTAQVIEEVMSTEDTNRRKKTKNIPGSSAPSIIDSPGQSRKEIPISAGSSKMKNTVESPPKPRHESQNIFIPSKISAQDVEEVMSTDVRSTKNIPGPSAPSIIVSALSPSRKEEIPINLGEYPQSHKEFEFDDSAPKESSYITKEVQPNDTYLVGKLNSAETSSISLIERKLDVIIEETASELNATISEEVVSPTEPVPSTSKEADVIKIGKPSSKLDTSKELDMPDSGLIKLEAEKDANVITREPDEHIIESTKKPTKASPIVESDQIKVKDSDILKQAVEKTSKQSDQHEELDESYNQNKKKSSTASKTVANKLVSIRPHDLVTGVRLPRDVKVPSREIPSVLKEAVAKILAKLSEEDVDLDFEFNLSTNSSESSTADKITSEQSEISEQSKISRSEISDQAELSEQSEIPRSEISEQSEASEQSDYEDNITIEEESEGLLDILKQENELGIGIKDDTIDIEMEELVDRIKQKTISTDVSEEDVQKIRPVSSAESSSPTDDTVITIPTHTDKYPKVCNCLKIKDLYNQVQSHYPACLCPKIKDRQIHPQIVNRELPVSSKKCNCLEKMQKLNNQKIIGLKVRSLQCGEGNCYCLKKYCDCSKCLQKRKEKSRKEKYLIRKLANMFDGVNVTDNKTEMQFLLSEVVERQISKIMDKDDDLKDVAAKIAKWIEIEIKDVEKNLIKSKRKRQGPTFHVRKNSYAYDITPISDELVKAKVNANRSIIYPQANQSQGPMEKSEFITWARWASDVIVVAEKWANWIDKTCVKAKNKVLNRNETRTKSEEIKHKKEFKKWQEGVQSDALEWQRNKKMLKQVADFWNQKADQTSIQ